MGKFRSVTQTGQKDRNSKWGQITLLIGLASQVYTAYKSLFIFGPIVVHNGKQLHFGACLNWISHTLLAFLKFFCEAMTLVIFCLALFA